MSQVPPAPAPLANKAPFTRVRTRRDTQRRIFILVGGLGSVQFVVNALTLPLPPQFMVVLWLAAGFLAAVGSMAFEM